MPRASTREIEWGLFDPVTVLLEVWSSAGLLQRRSYLWTPVVPIWDNPTHDDDRRSEGHGPAF